MTDEKDRRKAVACRRSQNVNGGKAGPGALGTFQFFPGPSMHRTVVPSATWVIIHRRSGLSSGEVF